MARHNEDMVEIPEGRFHMGERKDRVQFPQAGFRARESERERERARESERERERERERANTRRVLSQSLRDELCSMLCSFKDGEGPVRPVRMSSFWMDRFEVSNEKWQEFARETGYLTDAERLGDSFVAELYLSAAVNASIDKKVDAVPWWLPVPNASWQKPEGIDARQARRVFFAFPKKCRFKFCVLHGLKT